MSTFRPLPSSPSLEFEHKEAKALLRQLRAGDVEGFARARARHPAITDSPRLADAQLVIAREYGFASWPRLVRYFEGLERQRQSPRSIRFSRREAGDMHVQSLLARHRARRASAGRAVAALVPRFYGMPIDTVLDTELTEDEARLVVARLEGFSSWDDLLERGVVGGAAMYRQREDDPFRAAMKALESLDLDALQRVVAGNPHFLHPTDIELSKGRNLMAGAIHWERRHSRAAMRPIMDWLETQGFDRQLVLNDLLCGRMQMKPDEVRALLDQGADPNWIAPNGIPVLEHALVRYWNGGAVDILARLAVPRRALWIAAGLGDVDGVRRFLDRDGRPTPEARQLRPPFDLVSYTPTCAQPDADDEEILMEAFFVAMLNGRTAVLEYMASHGTPVDSSIYGGPLIHMAISNRWTPVVECLVRCGADLDLRAEHPPKSAREVAREMFTAMPQDADCRRIVELYGMDPDAIMRDTRPEREQE